MTTDRRTYAREYARKRRAAARAARTQGRATCPAGLGRYGQCGGRIEVVTDGMGRTTVVCPRCERRRRGLCRDCNARVEGTIGRALRCAACKRLARQAAEARYVAGHERQLRARARKDARRRAKTRAEYKRIWRQANPERVRRQKQRYAARHPDKIKAYHKAYRAAPRGAYTSRTEPRTCVAGCGAVVSGRVKKCLSCRAQSKRTARETLLARYLASQERAA